MKEKGTSFGLSETLAQMKDLVRLSLNSTKKKLFKKDRKSCFEIFGYDFLLQDDGHAFLIEANTNPCIEESNQLLANLIPRMLSINFHLFLLWRFGKLKERFKLKNEFNSNTYINKLLFFCRWCLQDNYRSSIPGWK